MATETNGGVDGERAASTDVRAAFSPEVQRRIGAVVIGTGLCVGLIAMAYNGTQESRGQPVVAAKVRTVAPLEAAPKAAQPPAPPVQMAAMTSVMLPAAAQVMPVKPVHAF